MLLVSTYIIPLGCMALCYARMGANLWGTEMVGEETPALMKSRQSKQKVTGGNLFQTFKLEGSTNIFMKLSYYCKFNNKCFPKNGITYVSVFYLTISHK